MAAPMGCGTLVSSRGPELLAAAVAGLGHRDRDAGSLRDVLQPDREDDEQAEPGDVGGVGRPDREALREAVDEQHQEDEHRQPGARPGSPAESRPPSGSAPTARHRQEQHSGRHPGEHGPVGALVEARLRAGRRSRRRVIAPAAEPVEGRLPGGGASAEPEDRDRPEPGCQRRRRAPRAAGSAPNERKRWRGGRQRPRVSSDGGTAGGPDRGDLHRALQAPPRRRIRRDRGRDRQSAGRASAAGSSGTSTRPPGVEGSRRCCTRCSRTGAAREWTCAG